MKLSAFQAMVLLEIAKDSLRLSDSGKVFGYDLKTRQDMVDEIVNQQDHQAIHLDDVVRNV